MKVEELHVGSWVMHDGVPKRVDVIWGNAVSLYDPRKTWGSIYTDKYPIEEISPLSETNLNEVNYGKLG